MADVTDATFATQVVERSNTVAVVVDLWAPWCGPCKTLGPILERAVAAADGKVELAKVNVDENPQTAQAFQVQGIPAVYAMRGGKVVDGFVGAQGEAAVAEFVRRLLPTEQENEVEALVAAGDEASLRRALELDADHEGAVVGLADLLVAQERREEALELLERIPETAEVRRVAALARTGARAGDRDVETRLENLLGRVKADPAARQEFVDLLEIMGADDPRTPVYRRRLTAQIY
ncbi:MAG: tetratricopeptide repeat protein [bacterium]|nr:tetratricopeptide repeat protein [bacterium]MCY4193546.1 tetratricopeptide repeat protein [bacterium]MCY4273174.1 tetratricopeptide repeat protein [bacterium]